MIDKVKLEIDKLQLKVTKVKVFISLSSADE